MTHTLHYALHEVADYINWLYFFHAWGFPARYGSIAKVHGCKACRENWISTFSSEEQARAKEAIKLYDDAQELLNQCDEQFRVHAIVGIFPANSDNDNIVLTTDDNRERTIPLLRQQTENAEGTCLCLSDFIMPRGMGKSDQIGLFVATVDKSMEDQYPNDNYHHMLCQTLADRLAEATAEKAHEIVRKQLWGYAPDENFSVEELFCESYQGRRPAVGYPSLPDQSINFLLSDILNFPTVGISLTSNGAMIPHASTSGLMFAHPATRHFAVGKIGKDQLQDYATRRGITLDQAQQFLSSYII